MTQLRATQVVQPPLRDVFDTITLDQVDRHRRRFGMVSDGGLAFLLDLETAQMLTHGDGLALDDGRVIEVRAVSEALYDVRGTSPEHLLKLAWQLGNRHLPAQIFADRILIRKDPVIAEMIAGLGGTITEIDAPFTPEHGAYHHHHAK
ncbi:MAG: urease accessory protein UreE [Pseudomonadota bacterium]